MTQLTINIENKKMVPHLKKILNAIEGVSIAPATPHRRKCGLDLALEDVEKGRLNSYDSVDEMFKALGL